MSEDRQKWLEWRRAGIGSSDAPAVHGASPYLTRYDLFQQKVSTEVVEEKSNFAMDRGNELEPIARQRFAAIYNMEHGTEEDFAARCLEMAELPFMRASLDGCSKDGKIIIEIKYQGKDAHAATANGDVPKKYWIQMQHQLFVSGAEFGYFISFNGETLFYTKVFPDTDFFVDHLKICTEFWSMVQENKCPEFADDDFTAFRKKGNTEKMRALAAAVEEMIPHLDKPRMHCAGIRIFNDKDTVTLVFKKPTADDTVPSAEAKNNEPQKELPQ